MTNETKTIWKEIKKKIKIKITKITEEKINSKKKKQKI